MKFNLKQIKCGKCNLGIATVVDEKLSDFRVKRESCRHCSGTGLLKAYVISEEALENVVEALTDMKEYWSLKGTVLEQNDLIIIALASLVAPEENK